LTPIEGTLLTARDYFKGTLSNVDEGYKAGTLAAGGCYPLPESCGKNFVVLLTDGLPSTSAAGVAQSNPTTALAAAAAAAAALKAEGVETYVIGFALPEGVNPTTLNQIAVAGGTETAYSASTQASLQAAFNAIFEDIERKTSAFGAVSQNSTSIDTGSMVFQGRFSSADWSGEVLAMRPDAQGNLAQVWSTSEAGRIAAPASRKVFTLKPGVGGVAFKLSTDLTAAQQTALANGNCSATLTGALCAQARIDWLRGDRSLEDPVGPLRLRSKVMGDIISSSPFYVKSTNTVFVGGNDGMLHALDGATGTEHFAFVPNAVIANLPLLTATNYSHTYFVDGDITVSSTVETPGKNILVGALGRGGKGLYALDVTSPSGFDASKVMWEFPNAATDPADVADIGLVLSRPVIAKLNTGQTAVIVGNGYNSTNERAVLFVLDINTGAVIKKIDTAAGSAAATNGMASPRGWDSDGSGTLDLVYAGDLLGNVWKFDLSAASANSWGASYQAAGKPAPLFVAKDSSNNLQPITGMIGVGMNYRKGDLNFGKRFVFVGTGRYITTTDVTNTATQSWYGLIDDDTTTMARSDLKLRTIEYETTTAASSVRAFSAAVAGDMAAKRGWVVDMVSPLSGAAGERFLGEHKFFGTVLTASSMIPRDDTCKPGGDGYINAIDPFTGASVTNLFFDANNDLLFTDADRLGAGKRPVGSVRPNINIPSDALLIGNRLVSSGTSGDLKSLSINNPIRNGRITWREVVNK
jgi:type IV pilus assembly protein PilY1